MDILPKDKLCLCQNKHFLFWLDSGKLIFCPKSDRFKSLFQTLWNRNITPQLLQGYWAVDTIQVKHASLVEQVVQKPNLISAAAIMKESSSKTESRGRRLLIAVILFLAGAGVVLIAGVIFMQEEITSLRGKVAELKPLQGSNVLHFFKTYHWTIGFVILRYAVSLACIRRLLKIWLIWSFSRFCSGLHC